MANQPTKYRKFLAGAATASLVATAVVPSALAASFTDVADNNSHKEAIDALSTAGIIKGFQDGSFGPNASLTRSHVVKMMGKWLESLNYEVPADYKTKQRFSDISLTTNDEELLKYSALVADAGVFKGNNGKLEPSVNISRENMAVVLVRAYDSVYKTDLISHVSEQTWNRDVTDRTKAKEEARTAIDVLDYFDITNPASPQFNPKNNVTRGQFASFLYKTINLEVPSTAPEVKSVTALNSREIVIEFNTVLDDVTAETLGNYSLRVAGNAISSSNYDVEIDDAGRKVTLTLDHAQRLTNDAAVQLVVNKNILNKNLVPGKEDYSRTWVFSDKAAPAIVKAEKSGSDLKVTFDDYVTSAQIAKVNGIDVTSSIVPIPANSSTKEITITNGAAGLGNGTYQVLVSGVVDAAGNTSGVLTGSITVSDDTVAPQVSKVEQIGDNQLKVTFNKAVTGANFVAKKNGYNLATSVAQHNGREDIYIVTLADNSLIKVYDQGQSTSPITLEITGFKAKTNNIFGASYVTGLTLSKDTAAPTVVTRFNEIVDLDAGAGYNEVFNIRFNEAVSVNNTGGITLTDTNGVRQSIDSATVVADSAGNNTILQIRSTAVQANGAVKAGTYTINLAAGAVKDASGNNNAATTVSVAKSSSASDVAASAVAANNVITVSYGSPMSTTAIAQANYLLDGKNLPAGTNIYFDANTVTVKIELPVGTIASTGGAVLSISDNVTSTAGSKVATTNRTQNIGSGFVDNVKPVLVSARKASETTVELTFSENVDGSAVASLVDDFIVNISGTNVPVSSVVDGTVGDNKITLTLPTYNTSQTVSVSANNDASKLDLTDLSPLRNKLTAGTTVTAN